LPTPKFFLKVNYITKPAAVVGPAFIYKFNETSKLYATYHFSEQNKKQLKLINLILYQTHQK
jgi:hypothetical protein